MSHHCHAEGCTTPVPPRMFSCKRHWGMLPLWLQRALWDVYRPGQEITKKVTPVYLLVQTRCRVAIAEHEGRAQIASELRDDLLEALRVCNPSNAVRTIDDFDVVLQTRNWTRIDDPRPAPALTEGAATHGWDDLKVSALRNDPVALRDEWMHDMSPNADKR